MAERASVEFTNDFKPDAYVARAVNNSDCRSPVIFIEEDGNPFASVCYLARQQKSAVWNFDMAVNPSATNVMDYVEVGVNNGDWVYVSNCDAVDASFFRDVARTLYALHPDPKIYPRRECFRAFFTVAKPFEPNKPGVQPFPPMFLQDAIIARKLSDKEGKWSRIIPAHAPLFAADQMRRQRRRDQGRDSDSESDMEDDDRITGKLFVRAAERYKTVDNSPVTESKAVFEQAVVKQDVATIRKLVDAAEVDVSRPLPCGLTPLQYACSAHLTDSAIVLLELGADPKEPRASDKCPPMFMALEDVRLAKALLDAGANPYAKYQGYRVDNHPFTSLEVSKYISKRIAEQGQ